MVKMPKNMFAVIGHPIKHSLSPRMHNAVFKELGLDYEYLALDVDESQLGQKITELREKAAGINVTIPHKVNVIKYVDEVSGDAKLVGAINTIKFGNRAVGFNTDGIGCMKALDEKGVNPAGRKVLLVGAGGAARAIGFQLAKKNSKVSICDMYLEKALNLAHDIQQKTGVKVKSSDIDEGILERLINETDIIINATPIGMKPNTGETPIKTSLLKENQVVMDIIYNPIETKLLKEAKMRGCKTIDGVGMFVHQGAEALKIWLGIQPPIELMRKTVIDSLK